MDRLNTVKKILYDRFVKKGIAIQNIDTTDLDKKADYKTII